MISVPQINIARLEEVPDLLGDPQEVVAAVLMHMLGDLTGRTLLMFPEAMARKLCDMLLRRAPGTTTVFDALEQSCLKEAGNILSGAYMNALSDFMGMLLLPSVPSLVVDLSAAVLTTTYLNFGRSEEHTSELQSRLHLVCRLLLEKKKKYSDVVSLDQVVAYLYLVRSARQLMLLPGVLLAGQYVRVFAEVLLRSSHVTDQLNGASD